MRCWSFHGQEKEDVVKAAFIEKFTHHIEWPNSPKADSSQLFLIIVVGDQSFYELMQKAYDKRNLKGKQVKVVKQKKLSGNENAGIIYIGEEKVEHIKKAKLACQQQPCLILSEFQGFAEEGVHINFYITKDETVHFEMNKIAMDNIGFKQDFLLVEFAKIVSN